MYIGMLVEVLFGTLSTVSTSTLPIVTYSGTLFVISLLFVYIYKMLLLLVL